jgi:NTP pyrophosphatase (non-canonical NTP hydrolase)
MISNETPRSLAGLQAVVRRFCEDRDWDQFHCAKDLAIGIATEAGELLQHFRFQTPEQVEALFAETHSRRAIESEVSDVLIFLLRLADRYAIDLAKGVEEKLAENGRRYPIEHARGRNQKAAR